MKICRITTTFVPPWQGLGPGPYEISVAQARLGNKVTVITKDAEGSKEFDKKQAFKIIRIKAKHDVFFSLKATYYFIKLNSKNPFDIIHNHGNSALILLVLNKLKLLNTPIVSSVHIVRKAQYKAIEKIDVNKKLNFFITCDENLFNVKPIGITNKRTLFFEKLYFKYSTFLTPVNVGLAEEINREYGIMKKVIPIFNGVNPSVFVKSHTNLVVHNSLIFVGGLNARKGEIDLINAIKILDNENFDTTLTIIGNGPLKKELNKLLQSLKLINRVKIINNISHEVLAEYLYKHELFILPSYSEGLPKVVLEAMITETPVLVSDITAHKGIIKDKVNGYLFKTGDEFDLAEKIMFALNNKALSKKIAERAKKDVLEKYTWDAVAKRLEIIYNILNHKKKYQNEK